MFKSLTCFCFLLLSVAIISCDVTFVICNSVIQTVAKTLAAPTGGRALQSSP